MIWVGPTKLLKMMEEAVKQGVKGLKVYIRIGDLNDKDNDGQANCH